MLKPTVTLRHAYLIYGTEYLTYAYAAYSNAYMTDEVPTPFVIYAFARF